MHLQIRGIPARSPADLGAYLAVLERAGINIIAAGGSRVEHGGEFAFAVEHGTEDAAMAALAAEDFKPRLVEVQECWMTNKPGQLLMCVSEAVRLNAISGRKIVDLSIGVPDERGHIPVQIYSE